MEIMKFFIRKRSEIIKKAAFGSALFMVSAFAVFTARADEKKDNSAPAAHDVVVEKFCARSVFEDLHSSALEILPKSTRLDMLDYWDVDSVYKASNVMDGLSWLEAVTPDYLKVRITPVSTLEIKILPVKKGEIAMTVYTVGDNVQAQDSQIKFYDENLAELPADKYIEMPKIKDFFEIPKGATTKIKEIEEMIPFPTIAFEANADNTDLNARLTVEKYMNEDDWNIAKLFAVPSVTLVWHKDKYKVAKR